MSVNTDQWLVLGPAIIRAVELFIDVNTAAGAALSRVKAGLWLGISQPPGPTKAGSVVYMLVLRGRWD